MKLHWGYIGKYNIVLTKGHISIFEKKNEPERTDKDWIINHASVVLRSLPRIEIRVRENGQFKLLLE